MQTGISHAASRTFAANRARGAVAFDVHLQDGVTRRRVLHESGSLRVRFPSPEDEGLSAVFVNTAGGVAGGDRFDTEIAVGAGARLTLTTAAAGDAIVAAYVETHRSLRAVGREDRRGSARLGPHPSPGSGEMPHYNWITAPSGG